MIEEDRQNNLPPEPAGIVSRIVNFVVKSSPIRGSSSSISSENPPPQSSPLALDEEVSAVNRKLKTNIHMSNINFSSAPTSTRSSFNRSFSGETRFFTPENSSLESIGNVTQFAEDNDVEMAVENGNLQRTSNEELQKLNEVLQMTEITEASIFESKNAIPRTNSLESAVKIELLQEEVASLQDKLSRSNTECRELRSLIEEYENTMSLIIGMKQILILL